MNDTAKHPFDFEDISFPVGRHTWILRGGRYANGVGALVVYNEKGEPETKVSINYPGDMADMLEPGEFYVDESMVPYSRAFGALLAQKIVEVVNDELGIWRLVK